MKISKLSGIQAEIQATEKHLTKLQASDGDVDVIARECGQAREKIDLLKRRETAENQRLEPKRLADRDKCRAACMKRSGQLIESELERYNVYRAAIFDHIQSTARLAADLYTLFDRKALELDGGTLSDLFTDAEKECLGRSLSQSYLSISMDEVIEIVWEVMSDRPVWVQEFVRNLFGTSEYLDGIDRSCDVPKRLLSVPVLDMVHALEGTPYPVEHLAAPEPVFS